MGAGELCEKAMRETHMLRIGKSNGIGYAA